MKRFIAFLRGINISGKNKVCMAELKKCFEDSGFLDVKTYLNSGNVAFSSDSDCDNKKDCDGDNDNDTDCDSIKFFIKQICTMLKNQFGFDIPVFVIEKEALKNILCHAPVWWGKDDKDIYDNLIFIMPPVTFTEVYAEIGDAKEGLEKIQNYENVIFWSFRLKDYQKTVWWPKTANASVSKSLTIRTANTVRKIEGL